MTYTLSDQWLIMHHFTSCQINCFQNYSSGYVLDQITCRRKCMTYFLRHTTQVERLCENLTFRMLHLSFSMKQFSFQNSHIYDCHYTKCNVLPFNTMMICISKGESLQESVRPKSCQRQKGKPIYTEPEHYCQSSQSFKKPII